MKIKLFTHTDFDGISNGILGILAFGKGNIDIDYCDYNNINEKISEFLLSKDINKYDKVFITDISVNNEVAKAIDIANKQYVEFMLLDHHPTALELNKYEWAKVEEETILLHQSNEPEVIEKISGTYLFFMYLLQNDYLDIKFKQYLVIKEFCEIVRKYDTWLWKNKYDDIIPKQWNDLFYIMGRNEFIESIIYRLTHYDTFDFCDFDLKLLQYKQREIDKYIESKDKEIIKKDILEHKAGIIFGEQYHSELGNKLCELHPELDFVIIINMSKAISYRSIGDKVNLGKDVAEVFGGGGHINSAGSPIDDDIREKLIDMIF